MNYEELMILAEKASEKAYVPYSKFPVGACILAESEIHIPAAILKIQVSD